MKFIKEVLLMVLLSGCTAPEKESLKEYVVGSWETAYMKVVIPTLNNTDSVSVLEYDYNKLELGKTKTNYLKDGTFVSWFQLSNGEKAGNVKGKWTTKKDTLLLDFYTLGKQIQVKVGYLITKTPEGFNGKSIYDYDKDGKLDDTLFVKEKRID